MEYQLELLSEPIVQSLNCHSYITGILGIDKGKKYYALADYLDIVSTAEEDDLWCEFINEKLTFAETCHIYDQTNCFMYDRLKFQDGLASFEPLRSFDFFVDFVKKYICNGYYLCGWFDEYYISYRSCYQKTHFKHDYLIYGFSDSEQVFLVAGYSNNGHPAMYSMNKVGYKDFHNAVMSVTSENDMSFFKIRENFDFRFPKAKMIDGLNAYLNSQNWNLSYYNYNDRPYVYGIQIEKQLCDYMQHYTAFNFNHDLMCFALLKDHKYVLLNLCELLYNDQVIDESLLRKSKAAYEKIKMLFALFLKTNFLSDMRKKDNMIKMNEIMQEVIEIEKNYIPSLVEAISKIPDEM